MTVSIIIQTILYQNNWRYNKKNSPALRQSSIVWFHPKYLKLKILIKISLTRFPKHRVPALPSDTGHRPEGQNICR